MMMLAGQRPMIFGDGKQSRDFTYVANIVQGNLLAAEVPDAAGQTFNIACGEQLDLLDLIAAINRVLGTKIEPIFDPPRVGDVRDSLADISLARQVLGYEPDRSISTKACAARSSTTANWPRKNDPGLHARCACHLQRDRESAASGR